MNKRGVCVIDGWREHDRDSNVCLKCELRMAGQLDILARSVPLLAVVVVTEPTAAGMLNLDALDLTLPGNPLIIGNPDDQIGHQPVAAALARWAEDWSKRDLITADATSVAIFLRRGLAWACREHPDILMFARDLRHHYAAVRAALGRNTEPVRYTIACPHCGRTSLQRVPGGDWIECKPCAALWDEDEYHGLAWQSLRRTVLPNEILSPQEAAIYAGVSVEVIWQWKHRGKISPDIGPWGAMRYLRIEIDWAQALMDDAARERARRRRAREEREERETAEMMAA